MNVAACEKRVFNCIAEHIGDFQAPIAIVLGSGLASMVESLEDSKVLSYDVLPNFTGIDIEGHAGNFVYGTIWAGQFCFCKDDHTGMRVDHLILFIFLFKLSEHLAVIVLL